MGTTELSGQPAAQKPSLPIAFKPREQSHTNNAQGIDDAAQKAGIQSALELVKKPALQNAERDLSQGALLQFSKCSNQLLTFVMNGDKIGYQEYVKLNISDFKPAEQVELNKYYLVLEKRHHEQMQAMRNFTEGLMTGDSNKVRQASTILDNVAQKQGMIDADFRGHNTYFAPCAFARRASLPSHLRCF